MPSFSDSIFLFILALLLFGPKKLPMLAREIGKWVGEFRRASNEFKMQMEDELRQSEQADRLKKIEAMEAAAPAAPALPESSTESATAMDATAIPPVSDEAAHGLGTQAESMEGISSEEPAEAASPLPIAEAGEVKLMPPSTGLPTPRSGAAGSEAPDRKTGDHGALDGLLGSIPAAEKNGTSAHADVAETAHGN